MYDIHVHFFSLYVHLLCLLIQDVESEGCSPMKFNKKHLNSRLEGYLIYNTTAVTITDCALVCFLQTNCLSFNMATSLGLCQLNSVNSSTNIEPYLVADNRFNYNDLSVFHQNIAGGCGQKPCVGKQYCLPTLDKHACIDRDCEAIKRPGNGSATINTAVIGGKTATFSCEDGFRLVGATTLKCQANGKWDGDNPICKPSKERHHTNEQL